MKQEKAHFEPTLRTQFSYALLVHIILILLLFTTLTQISLFFTQKKPLLIAIAHKIPAKTPAPVIFYDQHTTPISQKKQTTPSIKEKKQQETLKPEHAFTMPLPSVNTRELNWQTPAGPGKSGFSLKPGLPKQVPELVPDTNTTSNTRDTSPHTLDFTSDTLPHHETKQHIQKQEDPENSPLSQPNPISQKSSSVSHAPQVTPAVTSVRNQIQKQKPTTENTPSRHHTAQTKPRKKLTLADIFTKEVLAPLSTLSSINQGTTGLSNTSEGNGEQIVVREGDMRYYTLWAKFLEHLNQVAHFNHIQNNSQAYEWLRTGLIKNNFYCAVYTNKQGIILGVDIITSSGYKPFDDMCIYDIHSASPYPPLPESFPQNRVRYEIVRYVR